MNILAKCINRDCRAYNIEKSVAVGSFSGQQAEAAVGVAILNRMLDAGRPDSVRHLNIAE